MVLGSLAEAAGINTVTGGGGADSFDASGYATRVDLDGAGGNDTLIGGSAADELTSTGGTTSFRGRGGADTLTGSAGGTDTYVFEATGALNGGDTITDFVVAEDKADFSSFLSATSLLAAVESNSTGDVDITNKIARVTDSDGAVDAVDSLAEIAALFRATLMCSTFRAEARPSFLLERRAPLPLALSTLSMTPWRQRWYH